MIKFENTEVWGFEHALRGMRQPMQSHSKSDSRHCDNFDDCEECILGESCPCDEYIVGENDMNLAQRLIKGGSEHRKFLRQIFVSVDITAPIYFFKEFDTYKVGTTANSTSTMHKIHAKEFTLDDFSCEHLIDDEDMTCYDAEWITPKELMNIIIKTLNVARKRYLAACKTEPETGCSAKDIWWQLIQLLPSSYNQTRTITMTYENLLNMYRQRKNHKLDEWRVGFVEWVESLPYAKELIMYTGESK